VSGVSRGAGGQGDHLPACRPEAEGLIECSHDWRQFETTIGALKFPELQSNPQMLLGRSMHENSNMDSTINSSVTENN